MSETITIARPYAKAIFEYALRANTFVIWSKILDILALAMMNQDVQQFTSNPATTKAQQIELLMAPLERVTEEKQALINLLALLAENKRLMLLPDIKILFESLRALHEKTLVVEIRSFTALTDAQEEQLKNALSQRLQRKVTLNVSIDKSLLGGAIIRAGDLVINGSVQEQLKKLRSSLAA